jgi:hypothetical protein
MLTITILLASCIVMLSLPVNAAEKVRAFNKDLQVLSEFNAVIPDRPEHTFKMITETWKSTGNSEIANFWVTAVEQQDNIGGDTKVRGYGTAHYANGELSYFGWEGATKVSPKKGDAFEVTAGGTFSWLGGTGKYKQISGGGTWTCKGDQSGLECPWEGEPQTSN